MGGLSVIGGKVGGFNLRSVPGGRTRPVMAKVKEAVFNIVAPYILDSVWLDLFAGTGSVGIEALSRGAAFARFLDNQAAAVETIQANLKHTGLEDQAEVWHADAFSFLGSEPDRRFDFIYVAPPQFKEMWIKALQALDRHPEWLFDDGWVIVQIDKVEYQRQELSSLQLFDRRSYGSTELAFYMVADQDGEQHSG